MAEKIEVDPMLIETLKELHRRDIQMISERMYREAKRRQWCGEFDDIVDELNVELQVPIQRPIGKWRVEVFLTVEGRDEEEARTAADNVLDGIDTDFRIADIEEV